MDQPGSLTAGVLQALKFSLTDANELTTVLPTLEICFKSEQDEESLPEIISLILGSAAQVLSVSEVEQAILQPFLPLVKQFVSKTLSAISKVLLLNLQEETMISEIKKHLEVCIQVLLDMDSLLTYISDSNDFSVANVFSMPKNVAEITCEVFAHCQKSKEEYGEVFSVMHTDLVSLFQKCQKVHQNLLAILKEKLNFDCSCHEELDLLITVLDVLSSMAEYLVDLDTMTLVTHWKAYAWLTQTYASDLCSRLQINPAVSCLTKNICSQLSNLADLVSDKKLLARTVKVTGLFVKVLIKLCENYKGYLDDCHKDLLDCLISLSGYTAHLLSQQGVPGELVTHITTQALAGAAPLLSHLILDPLFVKLFFGFADELQSCSCIVLAGYSNLLVLVLKKLIQLSSKDDEIQDLWLKTDLSLIRIVLKVLQQSSTNGALFSVYEDDIYANLLGHTAAFILATCTENMFPQLERLLMEHLLQPILFPALFSSDLLCLVVRLGSSELCLQLTDVLYEVLTCWPSWDWHRPEWVYTSWTLSRLIPLLSTNHLRIFQSCVPSQTVLCNELCSFLNTPVSDDSLSQLKSIIVRLNLMEASTPSLGTNSAFADVLHRLWQHIDVFSADLSSSESSQWFLGLYSALANATCCTIESFSNLQIGYILDVLSKACKVNTTLTAFVACEFLRGLAKKIFTDDPQQSLVCQRISSLFKLLLKSENPLIKLVALEVFSYFAHLTKYEQIVPETVANNHQLQVLITEYFERNPSAFCSTPYLEHLQSLQSSFQHKCKVMSKEIRLEENDTEQNPWKKHKPSPTDEEIACTTLTKIEKDLEILEKYINCETISPSLLSQLQRISAKFGMLSNKCRS